MEPEQLVLNLIEADSDILNVHCEQSLTIYLHYTVNQVIFHL